MRERLTIALMVLVIGLAACGDSDGGEDGDAAATYVESDESILIKVRYAA